KDDWDYALGTPVGVIAVTEGIPFTEIEALETLFGVEVIPIAAGGINGGEGSFTFFIEGYEEDIKRAYEFLQGLKGEPPFPHVEHVKD
ncbi:MAG: hypothetical protein ACW98Y_03520, partial [Candidatus Thorarchaeota archaeon]